jgi:hypothetical protein
VFFGESAQGVYLEKVRTAGGRVRLRREDVTHVEDLAIASDNERSTWIAGSFSGSNRLSMIETTSLGASDGFVAKLTP